MKIILGCNKIHQITSKYPIYCLKHTLLNMFVEGWKNQFQLPRKAKIRKGQNLRLGETCQQQKQAKLYSDLKQA